MQPGDTALTLHHVASAWSNYIIEFPLTFSTPSSRKQGLRWGKIWGDLMMFFLSSCPGKGRTTGESCKWIFHSFTVHLLTSYCQNNKFSHWLQRRISGFGGAEGSLFPTDFSLFFGHLELEKPHIFILKDKKNTAMSLWEAQCPQKQGGQVENNPWDISQLWEWFGTAQPLRVHLQ